MGATTYPPLAELLDRHGLSGAAEEPFEHDGWSGAALTRLRRVSDGARFVLKRDSLARDWIALVTRDVAELREARLVDAAPILPHPVRLPHLGVGRDGEDVVLLMPDLSGSLLRWEAPIDVRTLDTVLAALAALHATSWHDKLPAEFPWTDLRRRVLLLTRRAAAEYEAAGNPVGERFRLGWEAFDRRVPRDARWLIDHLTDEPEPLLAALGGRPNAGLHGDLKLGNVALTDDGVAFLIDWQMTLVAPVAVELGWFLVSNVAGLPLDPDEVLDRYRRAAGRPLDDAWAADRDLAIVVGLLLRGWRKGLDADAGLRTASGWRASEDLEWWSGQAVAAASRRLV
jgi:aminoglycoside phosphotransferase (APT) family kinase protein